MSAAPGGIPITVNGVPSECPAGLSVEELLRHVPKTGTCPVSEFAPPGVAMGVDVTCGVCSGRPDFIYNS